MEKSFKMRFKMKNLICKIVGFSIFAFLQVNSQTVTTFHYTGAFDTYVVPAGASSIQITLAGAQGGGTGANPQVGGLGGVLSATLNVNYGDTFYIYVGGQGGVMPNTAIAGDSVLGGWNGGGKGYFGFGPAGGGGGATDIRTSTNLGKSGKKGKIFAFVYEQKGQ